VSASVNLPLHHKLQNFSSGTGSSGWSRKKGRKIVVVCGGGTCTVLLMLLSFFLLSWHSFHIYCLLDCVSQKWRTFGFVREKSVVSCDTVCAFSGANPGSRPFEKGLM